MFWVYILACSDGSYYTEHTDNLENRITQHEQGMIESCYTFKKRPVTLVFQDCFETREDALARERQIKGWSRAKKQALIQSNWQTLVNLSNGGKHS